MNYQIYQWGNPQNPSLVFLHGLGSTGLAFGEVATYLTEYHVQELKQISPNEPWSVKNQARMHVLNGSKPYKSAVDGIAHFPEIPTAIGVKLSNGLLEIAAPYGLRHLGAGIVEPTPFFVENNYEIYRQRMHLKQWHLLWPKLEINLQ